MFEEVKATFMSYLFAFNTLEPANVSGYFHLPAVLMASKPVELINPVELIKPVEFMNSIGDVEDVFRKLFKFLKDKKFKRSTLDSMQIKMVSENQAIVVGVATRYRKDESVLEHFGFTYTLRKTDKSFTINDVEHNWKIITGVIHEALDFSVIQSFELPQ